MINLYSQGLLNNTACVSVTHWFDQSVSVCPNKYTHIRGSRLVKTDDGEFSVMPKTPGEIAGEKLLRPLIDTVSDCFHRISSLLGYIDRAFSFPVVSAAPVPQLEKIREAIGALGNVALSEEMVVKIINDKADHDVQPEVINAIKWLIDWVGTISDPSEFYKNLVTGELESIAIGKLQKLAQIKKSYDQQLATFYAQNETRKKIGQLQGELTKLLSQQQEAKENELAKKATCAGIKSEWTAKWTEYNQHVDGYNKALAARDELWAEYKQRAKETTERDEAVQKYKHTLALEQLREAVRLSQVFRDWVDEHKPLIQHHDDQMKMHKGLIDEAKASTDRLQAYYTETERRELSFAEQRLAIEVQIKRTGEMIQELRSSLTKDEL